MIQLVCIGFLLIWAFWIWVASNGAGLIENAIFALIPTMATSGAIMFFGTVFAGAFGVFSK